MLCTIACMHGVQNVSNKDGMSIKIFGHMLIVAVTYIGDNAHFFCNRCKTTVPILNCSYECPNHSRMKNDCLIRTNPSRRNHYDVHSRVIVQFVRYAGIPWLRRLIENFEKSKCLYG